MFRILQKVIFILVIILLLSGTTCKIEEVEYFQKRLLKINFNGYSFYDVVTVGSVVSADILRAIAFVESGERDDAMGDGGWSIGRFQINERFREEHVKKYGHYDPRDCFSAARIAIRILENHYAKFGSMDLALTAYNGGPGYIHKYGINFEYLGKIKRASLHFN